MAILLGGLVAGILIHFGFKLLFFLLVASVIFVFAPFALGCYLGERDIIPDGAVMLLWAVGQPIWLIWLFF